MPLSVPDGKLSDMKLNLLGQPIELAEHDQEPTVSRHTGRELRTVEVSVDLSPERADAFRDALNSSRDDTSAVAGADGERWHVRGLSESYFGDEPHTFTFTVIEAENLTATTLEFGGFDLAPGYYAETRDDDGPLIIVAEFDLSGTELGKLEEFVHDARLDTTYFDVVRHGVVDTPLRMRLGQCLWQSLEGDARRHQLVFVGEDDDSEPPSLARINEPHLSNAQRFAVAADEIGNALIEELESAGVLDEAAAARIRHRAREAWKRRYRELDETDDLALFR